MQYYGGCISPCLLKLADIVNKFKSDTIQMVEYCNTLLARLRVVLIRVK